MFLKAAHFQFAHEKVSGNLKVFLIKDSSGCQKHQICVDG